MSYEAERLEGLKRAYRRAHLHLERMIEGLEEDHLHTQLQGTKESISRILQHILNAESYWLGEVKEARPDYVKRPDLTTTRKRFKELEAIYLDLIERRGRETAPEPTPAWIALRVAQHGIYHSAQIALIRRLLGVPAVEVGETAPMTWESAVDAVAVLALELHGG